MCEMVLVMGQGPRLGAGQRCESPTESCRGRLRASFHPSFSVIIFLPQRRPTGAAVLCGENTFHKALFKENSRSGRFKAPWIGSRLQHQAGEMP